MASEDPPSSTKFELSAPLRETEYANAFYTLLGGHDLTVVFFQTNPLMGAELEEANAKNAISVKPVGTIVLARTTAIALANQILQQANSVQANRT